MASSSSSTLEARLSQIQADLNALKSAVHKMENKQTRLQKIGTSRWESMNQEFKELREEIFEDKLSSLKDLENVVGGLGNRLTELEKKVEEMLKENGKTPKTEFHPLCSVYSLFFWLLLYVYAITNLMSVTHIPDLL